MQPTSDEVSTRGNAIAEHPLVPKPHRRAVNLRSLIIGVVGVLALCVITPYNDLVLFNSSLVGTYLPVALVFGMLALAIFVNAPLLKFKPEWALRSNELTVILAMMLVGCTIPGSGLMRYLPAHLIGLQFHSSHDSAYRELMHEIDLPHWMFPGSESTPPYERTMDPVVREYWLRVILENDTFLNRWNAVPWSAWITPAITWGVLISAMYTTVICLCLIIRHQWAEVERLPFPIANVYLALVETPAPGNLLNSVLQRRSFWLSFSAVFGIHFVNGISAYTNVIPAIPIHFDLTSLFAEPPLSYSEWGLQMSRIYFAVVGITFFMSTRVAFSLWFCFLLTQVAKMICGTVGTELTRPMQFDQQLGGLMMFGMFVLWLGRRHWLMVLRQKIQARPTTEPAEYVPYSWAGLGFIAGLIVMFAWLMLAGASLAGAVVLIGMLLLFFICIARIVAETGLIYAEIPVPLQQPWMLSQSAVDSASVQTTTRSFFLTSMLGSMLTTDLRDALTVHASHALRVADRNAADQPNGPGWNASFPACLALALLIAYLASGASMLYVEYNHSHSLDRSQTSPINSHAVSGGVTSHILDPMLRYQTHAILAGDHHNRLLHFSFGAGLVFLLASLPICIVSWPIHPIGFIMANTGPMRAAWFSILIGWILKVCILKLGGSRLFVSAKPFVLGLILGEATVSVVLIGFNLLLSQYGFPFENSRLLFG